MTRENKLAIVVGFGLLLFVGILVSDHLSARHSHIAVPTSELVAIGPPPSLPGGRAAGDRVAFGQIPEASGAGRADAGGLPIDDGASPIVARIDPSGFPGRAPGAEEPSSAERTHTVAAGEHPGDIAKRYYGKRALGAKLAEFNGVDPRRIRIGQVLRVPDIAVLDPTAAPALPVVPVVPVEPSFDPVNPAPAPLPEPEQPRFRTVKVAEGDTLFGIARRIYGDGTRWREIAQLNNLGDGAALRPGMEIRYASAR